MTSSDGESIWFADLYARTFQAVYAYVRRRVPYEADVPDLVADVFALAWTKQPEVPFPPDDRLWLLAVARRRLWEYQRGAGRQMRLVQRLADEPVVQSSTADSGGTMSGDLLAALERLRPTDREVVRLLAWEHLTRADAAVVLGCTPNAVSIRWHRAIRRLRRDLSNQDATDRTEPSDAMTSPSMEGDH